MPLHKGSFGGNVEATPLFQEIYRAVSQVPRGRVATYGDVALAVGAPRAARAVGTAMARNQDVGVVPCHRVVRSDGSVGGYGGGGEGVRKKIALLRREGVSVSREGKIRDFERLRFTSFK